MQGTSSYVVSTDQPWANPNNTTNQQIVWTFSTGEVITGDIVTYTPPIVYTGEVTVTLEFIDDSGVRCSGSKTFFVGFECNLRGSSKAEQDISVGNQDWRIDLKIWVDHNIITPGKVGSRTRTLRETIFGGYVLWESDFVYTQLQGYYYNSVTSDSPCTEIFIDRTSGHNLNTTVYTQSEEDINNVHIINGELRTTGSFIIDDVTYNYTADGGWLTLEL